MVTAQNKVFPLDGLLANVNPENLKQTESEGGGLLSIVMVRGLVKLSENLIKPHIPRCGMMTNDDIWSLKKPESHVVKAGITTRANARSLLSRCGDVGSFVTSTRTREGAFSDSIKKGSNLNAAPKYDSKFDQTSDASCFTLRRCRCFTSRSKAATTNCPVVSPDSFSCSTALATSWGTRAAIVCDFAFTDFVAITESQCVRCSTVWQKKDGCKHLTCSTPVTNMVFNTLSTGVAQKPKPGSASTLSGPLTTNVITSNEVAMFDNITPVSGRVPLGSKKFQFRFMALSRADMKAKPFRVSVQATSEKEARRVLAPHFILSLAARLPVQEVAHA